MASEKKIYDERGNLLCLIIPATFSGEGINFFTSETETLQIGHMKRPKNYKIEPHVHNPVERIVSYSSEALFIRKGIIDIYIYDENRKHVTTYRLKTGDVALLIKGGHGFKVVEEVDIVEVKQGPYLNQLDKVRFSDDTY